MASKKLLVLEDDANLSATLCDYLESAGYEVVPAYDGEEAQDRLYEQSFDLLLLDVNTPGVNGFDFLKEAREQGTETPAIFITARRSVEDLEEGFRSGADDYLRKPFELKELKIRIETLLQRRVKHPASSRISLGNGWEYDPASGRLFGSGGEEELLGRKEARLLELFVTHPGEVLSHERIYERLWDYGENPSDSALRTYIKNLRKRIGKERIVSLKKQGYLYRAAE
ncbi:response regulator transcription factor [Nitratifractor salsuginis]|uniref:Two component transcriptional regulator, winged helix family n=1 Tax=Nitratifractor salsuginis (strain DSM 16511 / JCM 12458 / E9I37-1) TaxID=749222 RepID=E6X009_NITSE|nr:response regulator transcription factor [Nitratifractor salsuginis]ADV46732.1 two component transcriptional regulator, winged helix family [Nitratifractor salsuginis DSM 16511]